MGEQNERKLPFRWSTWTDDREWVLRRAASNLAFVERKGDGATWRTILDDYKNSSGVAASTAAAKLEAENFVRAALGEPLRR